MGAVSSAPSALSDYDEDPTEATLIYETVNLNDVKNDSFPDNPKRKKERKKERQTKYKVSLVIIYDFSDTKKDWLLFNSVFTYVFL